MAETVTTETATEKPATGSGAFAAARASIDAPSQDPGAPEAKPDDTPPAKTVEDPEKVADPPAETTDDPDALLTPEEAATLTPKERGLYAKAQKVFTQKTQALAADRKALEEWQPLIEGMKSNPAATLEQVATHFGFTLSRKDATTVQKHTAEAMAGLPEELAFLKPVFEAQAAQILAAAKAEIAPIKEAHTAMVSEAAAAETLSTLKAFEKEHPGWKKHEAAMIAMGQKILPGKDMTDSEYMEILYRQVTAGIDEAERTKKTVEKINRSAAASESQTPGISDKRVEHALPPPDKRNIHAAFEAAKRGEVWADQ